MKKFLLLPAMILVLSGCGLQSQTQSEMPPNAPLAPVVPGMSPDDSNDYDKSVQGSAMQEEVITTTVEAIDHYDSSDELLRDVDAMMNDLDTL